MKTENLSDGFFQFGNKGAIWSNKTHIASNSATVTLCGTPMLSSNWANITKHQEIHCQECLERYELVELNITILNSFLVGETKDWKFGFCTRTVERLSNDLFIIHDTSGSWTSAGVDLETMKKICLGEVSLLDIDFV